MGQKTKRWLIAAASLTVLGLVFIAAVMMAHNWDFTKLNTAGYETNTYVLQDHFRNIEIRTDTADIALGVSDNGEFKVVCQEEVNAKHAVSIAEGKLTVNAVDSRKWYEHIGIHFGSTKVTILLPAGQYGALSIVSNTGDVEISKDFHFETIHIRERTGDVKNYASASEELNIKTSTGNIFVENLSAKAIELRVTTGRITASAITCQADVKIGVSTGKAVLTDVQCKNLVSDGDTGDLSLKNVIATDRLMIERTTGNITFDRCDAAEIEIETDTGDVTGSFRTDKVFLIETDTGWVNVPKTATGGKCQIETDTGNIKISIS